MGPLIWMGLGIFAFLHFTKKDDKTIIEEPKANPDLLTQPEQKFPLQKVETPRVDGADQPWYVDSREFMGKIHDGLDGFLRSDMDIVSYDTDKFWSVMNDKYSH